VVRSRDADTVSLDLEEPVRAIAPGQSGVCYAMDDSRVLGGGVIECAA
jgi:tRNA U34 2-thiouridine synthase MnmA/TrmU